MTLTVQSVRSVVFGMLNEQISFSANFIMIGPQENASLMRSWMLIQYVMNSNNIHVGKITAINAMITIHNLLVEEKKIYKYINSAFSH